MEIKIGRAECDYNVDDKDEIYCGIEDLYFVAGEIFRPEGNVDWDEKGIVNGQHND